MSELDLENLYPRIWRRLKSYLRFLKTKSMMYLYLRICPPLLALSSPKTPLLQDNSSSPSSLVYLQSMYVHTQHAAVTPRLSSQVQRVTFAQDIIPFVRQCTHPPGLTADIYFSVVTVGHRRKRATRSRCYSARLRQICLIFERKNLNSPTLVETLFYRVHS